MGDFDLSRPGNDVFAPEKTDGLGRQARGILMGGGADGVDPAQVGGQIAEQRFHAFAVSDFKRGLGGGPLLLETGFGPRGGAGAKNLQGRA